MTLMYIVRSCIGDSTLSTSKQTRGDQSHYGEPRTKMPWAKAEPGGMGRWLATRKGSTRTVIVDKHANSNPSWSDDVHEYRKLTSRIFSLLFCGIVRQDGSSPL